MGNPLQSGTDFSIASRKYYPTRAVQQRETHGKGVFIQAGKHAAQVFHDAAVAGPISEMLTDVSAVISFRPPDESRSAADAKAGPSQYLPQVVIALLGVVRMVSQVMLGPNRYRYSAGQIVPPSHHSC